MRFYSVWNKLTKRKIKLNNLFKTTVVFIERNGSEECHYLHTQYNRWFCMSGENIALLDRQI